MKTENIPDIRYLVTDNPYQNKPVKVLCVFHEDHNPSLYVYPDHTFCYVCRAHESARAFVTRLGGDYNALPSRLPNTRGEYSELSRTKQSTERRLRNLQINISSWHRTLVEGSRRHRREWLYERGLWDSTIARFKLGHTGDRFVIPLYNTGRVGSVGVTGGGLLGAPLSYQLRADPAYCDPEEVRYLSEKGGTESLWYTPGNLPLVITEGPLDAILVSQYGYATATTIRGAAQLASELRDFKFPSRAVIAVDKDRAGEQAGSDLQLLLPKATVARWEEGKDVTEALMKVPPIERGSKLREWFGG